MIGFEEMIEDFVGDGKHVQISEKDKKTIKWLMETYNFDGHEMFPILNTTVLLQEDMDVLFVEYLMKKYRYHTKHGKRQAIIQAKYFHDNPMLEAIGKDLKELPRRKEFAQMKKEWDGICPL